MNGNLLAYSVVDSDNNVVCFPIQAIFVWLLVASALLLYVIAGAFFV